jgi:hypothetical protein
MTHLLSLRIESFNQYLIRQETEQLPTGLLYGKMGYCIYFYRFVRYSGNMLYEKYAERLLDSVFKNVTKEMPVNFEFGLTGLCFGVLYLIENRFIAGNPNLVLKDLDDRIFSLLNMGNFQIETNSLRQMILCGIYLCKRLENNKLSNNERFLFQKIIVEIINSVENYKDTDKTGEPYPFAPFEYYLYLYFRLIHMIFKLNFYNYKVVKVCDEWTERLLSTIPLLQSHCFLLSQAMEKVNHYYKSPVWEKHTALLKQQTDIPYIIDKEFRNKNILLHNGLSGFAYLLQTSGLLTETYRQKIIQKLTESELWNDYENGDDTEKKRYLGLFSGLGGVILQILNLQNSKI